MNLKIFKIFLNPLNLILNSNKNDTNKKYDNVEKRFLNLKTKRIYQRKNSIIHISCDFGQSIYRKVLMKL